MTMFCSNRTRGTLVDVFLVCNWHFGLGVWSAFGRVGYHFGVFLLQIELLLLGVQFAFSLSCGQSPAFLGRLF
jgi:hypothetical protein